MASVVSHHQHSELEPFPAMQHEVDDAEHYFPEHSLGQQLDEVIAATASNTSHQAEPQPQPLVDVGQYDDYDSEDDEDDFWSSDEESQDEEPAATLNMQKTSDHPQQQQQQQQQSQGHKTVSLKTITPQDFYYDEKQLELDSHILGIPPLENGENAEIRQNPGNILLGYPNSCVNENESFFVSRGEFFALFCFMWSPQTSFNVTLFPIH
jgi:hypothetical protein